MSERMPSAGRAEQLREAFDQSFAAVPRFDATTRHDMLAIRMGTTRCALRLSEVRGIFSDKKITPVPALGEGLLGLASFRGTIVPVYALHTVLGIPADGTGLRWLAIAATGHAALAFETVEGHLRAADGEIAPRTAADAAQPHIQSYLRDGGHVRAIVDIPSITAAIAKQVSRVD